MTIRETVGKTIVFPTHIQHFKSAESLSPVFHRLLEINGVNEKLDKIF